MKDRITRYLAKNENFDIFSLEAYMQQAYLANDYTIKNTATINEALQNLVFFVWKTKEMSEMLQWMKKYNNGSQKILFTGFDMQDSSESIKQLSNAFSEDKEITQKMIGFVEVSHCYERPTFPDWPYNIYTMIHGKSEEECEKTIKEIADAINSPQHVRLYSAQELKKTSMQYFND